MNDPRFEYGDTEFDDEFYSDLDEQHAEEDSLHAEPGLEYDENPTYDDYNGSYAQDQEGWSDQLIDDALDGDPDAYWNID